MQKFEPVVLREKPDWVVVVGDVNSTLACALVAVKLGVKVAHVEAGLRSRDRTMPEEINRLLTDQIADLLFTPSRDADENLRAEGIPDSRIRFVGNIMIDSLCKYLERAKATTIRERLGFAGTDYAVLTLHRPSNVDDRKTFSEILDALAEIARRLPIIFPVHPRTHKTIVELGLAARMEEIPGLRLIEPLGYLDFLGLYSGAKLVLTDSGGLQEETTVLGHSLPDPAREYRAANYRGDGYKRRRRHKPAKITGAAFAALDRRLSTKTPPPFRRFGTVTPLTAFSTHC